MKLVIVESPSKAKTINKYLGKDYYVLSSFGHIRDLPSKIGSVEPEKDFKMHYAVNKSAIKNLKAIIDQAKKAKIVYLASDPDREGEAISWHIIEVLRQKKVLKKGTEVKRIVFNQITKKAIKHAIEHPRDISMDLVNAQQARRALDYLVGFYLSPVLWRKLPGSKSAGRVQSVTLRLICEREDEIDKFVSQEYWSIDCLLNNKKAEFKARLFSINSKKLDKFAFGNEKSIKPVVEHLAKSEYSIISVEKKKQNRNPYPPFITSTLQQEASRKLRFGAKKTMMIAQKLYEGFNVDGETVGLITYMRTDGVDLSQDAVSEARKYISENFGKTYLHDLPRSYKTKIKNAQEAHEAIRPTHIFYTPKKLSQVLDADHLKLYDLIWKRMLACQMRSAILDQILAIIETKDKFAQLKAVGSTVEFDGFYKIYKEGVDRKEDEEKESILPELNKGDTPYLIKVIPEQHHTEPAPRYSEASLVKKMEELGIGRPSTYTSIISVLQDRKYVTLENRRFFPEDRGRLVTAFLMSFFERYVEYDFTSQLEDKLDLVSSGEFQWKDLLKEFWHDFYKATEDAKEYKIEEVIKAMSPLIEHYVFPTLEDGFDPHICPKCDSGKLEVRISRFGPFVSCNKYPDCKYTRKLDLDEYEEDTQNHIEISNSKLGNDPATGLDILLKNGPYGFYVQLGESDDKNMKRSAIPKGTNMEDVDLDFALSMLSLPREIGKHPETEKMITAAIGKFGPYIKHNKKFTSLPNIPSVFSFTIDQAVQLIASSSTSKNLGKYKKKDVLVQKGRFGPYIKFGKKNVKLPKGTDIATLSLEQVQEIIDSQ